jgi:hypothetical protein
MNERKFGRADASKDIIEMKAHTERPRGRGTDRHRGIDRLDE